jgi:hypothetical protein
VLFAALLGAVGYNQAHPHDIIVVLVIALIMAAALAAKQWL